MIPRETPLAFIAEKVRTQISIENARRLQTWAFGLLALFTLTSAVTIYLNVPGRAFLALTQVLFLAGFHGILAFGIYLPQHLQKDAKVLSRVLGIRDFTSLVFMSLVLSLVAGIVFQAGYQVIRALEELRPSGGFAFASWGNVIFSGIYLAGFVFYFAGLIFSPRFLAGALETLGRRPLILFAAHVGGLILSGIGYAQVVEIGSTTFFEQLRLVALFWVCAAASVFWVARMLEESSLPGLTSLEMEIASGWGERTEDVVPKFKEAFISRRLLHWLERLSKQIGQTGDEIAQALTECVTVISQPKPTEAQIGWLEERYRRAVAKGRRLDRRQQKFFLALSFLDLLEVERERVEMLKDQFSKEIRHAKLELASVRKKIDEKLQSLKESERPAVTPKVLPSAGASPSASPAAEKVPVSR